MHLTWRTLIYCILSKILTDLKGEINNNTITVGNFNTSLSSIDRSSRQKINKETLDLNYTLDQMDITDMYRTFHPTTEKYIFFLNAPGTFSRMHYMIGYKTSFSKFKKVEIIPSIFSNHNGMNLEINKKKAGNFSSMWKLNNTLLTTSG